MKEPIHTSSTHQGPGIQVGKDLRKISEGILSRDTERLAEDFSQCFPCLAHCLTEVLPAAHLRPGPFLNPPYRAQRQMQCLEATSVLPELLYLLIYFSLRFMDIN